MGKASKGKGEPNRRAKIAAQRAAEQRAERRRRLLIGGGAVVAVVAVKLNAKSGTAAAASNGPTGASLTSVVNNVINVPQSTLDTVGGGSIDSTDVGQGTSS